MSLEKGNLYCFDGFVLDASERLLKRGDETISVPPKAVETLCLLVENHGKLMSKDILMEALWGDTFVEERNLAQNIFTLRKALGESNGDKKFIETVPKRGYRFVAEVQIKEETVIEIDVSETTKITATEGVPIDELSGAGSSPRISDGRNIRKTLLVFAAIMISAFALGLAGFVYLLNYKPLPESKEPWATDKDLSVAVMPFENASGDKELEYLSEGLTESLITGLAKIPGLKVKSRNVVFRYASQNRDISKLREDLSVEAVLLGVVNDRKDRVSLAIELVDTATRDIIWSENFERDKSSLLGVRNDIARSVSSELKLALNTDVEEKIRSEYTSDPSAFEAYLKGRYHWNKRTKAGLTRAIGYFKEAIAVDPQFALAHLGLADCHLVLPNYSDVKTRDSMRLAKEAAERAIKIDPALSHAYSTLATVQRDYDWAFKNAEASYKKAIELDPDNMTAHSWYSELLNFMARSKEGVDHAKRARRLDPLDMSANVHLGVAYFFDRKFDESVRAWSDAIELSPTNPDSYHGRAMARSHLSDARAALNDCARVSQLSGNKDGLCEAYVHAVVGNKAEALELISSVTISSEEGTYTKAQVLALSGKKQEAIGLLEGLVEGKALFLLAVKVEPAFEGMKNEKRFTELVKRIGL